MSKRKNTKFGLVGIVSHKYVDVLHQQADSNYKNISVRMPFGGHYWSGSQNILTCHDGRTCNQLLLCRGSELARLGGIFVSSGLPCGVCSGARVWSADTTLPTSSTTKADRGFTVMTRV